MLTFLRNIWHAQHNARAVGVYARSADYWCDLYNDRSRALIARGNDHTKEIEALRLRHAAELAAHGRPTRGKGGRFERNGTEPRLQGAQSPGFSGCNFQTQVATWLRACFGPLIAEDGLERGDRLLEEVLELLQSGNYPADRVEALKRYVYNRPKGEPAQEVGGVMVTLAAYCHAHAIDMHGAAETELTRIQRPEIMEKIRAKQATKPPGSALPANETMPQDERRLWEDYYKDKP